MDATSLSNILFKLIIVVLLLVIVLNNTNTDIYNKINDIVGIENWYENRDVTGSNTSSDNISVVTNDSLAGKTITARDQFEDHDDELFETLKDMRGE